MTVVLQTDMTSKTISVAQFSICPGRSTGLAASSDILASGADGVLEKRSLHSFGEGLEGTTPRRLRYLQYGESL